MNRIKILPKNIIKLEKLIVSKNNRFPMTQKQNIELKKSFAKENILITGAVGSIGKSFTSRILDYDFNFLFLLDKNENELTKLNRKILLYQNQNNKNIKINYICSDLTSFDLENFIKSKKISVFLNFAAIKHVRSEEEFQSAIYMLKTNSFSFIPKKKYNLKKVFSVSSDKSVNPHSILGFSKSLMENNLADFKKKNQKVFVSSTRFANVCFSNGSIFEHALGQIIKKEAFGIPSNIKRYFITHDEAVNLCLKSLLKKNDGFIIIPNNKKILKIENLKNKIIQLIKYFGYRVKFVNFINKNLIKNNYFSVILTNREIVGQKKFEIFSSHDEKVIKDLEDSSINKIVLKKNIKEKLLQKKLLKTKNLKLLKKEIKKIYKNFKLKNNKLKISKII